MFMSQDKGIPRASLVELFIAVALAMLTLVVYCPCFDHPFITFDDPDYVTENRHVQAGLTADSIGWALTTFACGNLIRTLIVESGQLKKGDGLDFCHAVMASAFASVATLDKHWKRRVENLPKPNKLAHIYSKGELDTMVTDIEFWVKQQHGPTAGNDGAKNKARG